MATEWEAQDGELVMTMTPDAEFLRNARYPVTIDPTVQSGQVVAKIGDCFISEAKSTTNYGTSTTLRVGKHAEYDKCKSLVKVSDLPVLSNAYTIAKAWMAVVALPTGSNTEDAYVRARGASSAWDPKTATWANQPVYEEKELDYALVKKGEPDATGVQFDITNAVRAWYADQSKNDGVLLETDSDQPITLCASENTTYTATARPAIYVNYVSKAGLESYLSYEAFGVGRAGTAHVALHSGHLVVTRGITSMNGNRLPISLGLVWNACAMDKNAFGVGNGWRLSWNQSLRREKPETGDTYYVFTDEDGTEHEFCKHEKNEEEKKDTAFVDYYGDRSGLSLKLYEVGAEAEIVSKGHSKLVFDKPTVDYTAVNNAVKMIKRVLDAQGNAAAFTHDASFKLTKVTDGAGRVTTLTYTAGEVRIAPPGYAAQVALALDANQRMTRVTDLDGQWSEYEYVGGTEAAVKNRLKRVRNAVDGCQAEPAYDHSGRVSEMHAFALANGLRTDGNARGYQYFDCVTQVKDLTVPDGKVLTYQFNDYGNVVAVHDELGFAAFARFGAQGKPNTPEAVSKLQRLVVNLLDEHDFTADSGWKTGLIGADGVAREAERVGAMSLKPLCLERPGSNETSYAQYDKACEAGEYTFSVHVRSRGDALAWAELAWQGEGSQWHAVASERVRRVGSALRLSCTLNLPAAAMVRCRVLAGEGSGAVWFDRAQLERGALASRHNLLRNANFTTQEIGMAPEGWMIGEGSEYLIETQATPEGGEATGGGEAPADGETPRPKAKLEIAAAKDSVNKPKDLGANCLRMQGTPGKKAGAYQELDIQGEAGDNYVVGGWCRAWADGGTADWNDEWVDWQYACGAAVAPGAYRRLQVYIEYDENLNEVQVGVVSLVKEYYGRNFAYDEKNNVKAVSTLLGEKDKAEYDKWDNLTSYVQPGRDAGDRYTFFYGDTDGEKKRHLVEGSETPLGVATETKHDAFGNANWETISNKTDAYFLRASASYTADGNYAAGATDAQGMTTQTQTDPDKGLVLSVTDAAGQAVRYQYDAANRVVCAQTTAQGKLYRNVYTYEKDRLSTVSHNTTGDTPDVTYTFQTDALGNQSAVKIGMRTLSENQYSATGDKLLEAVTYGNGGKVQYSYDSFKRATGVRYDNAAEPRFTYEYGANGAVGRVKDAELGREARMGYDLAERPAEAELYENGALKYRLTQEYDRFEQPSALHERVEEPDDTRGEYSVSAQYDKEGKPAALTYESVEGAQTEGASKRKLTYAYDGLGRMVKRGFHADAENEAPAFQSEYSFAAGGYGASSTTARVRAISQAGGKHEYWYDSLGNITRERQQSKAAGGTPGGALHFDGQPLAFEEDGLLELNGAGVSARYDTTYAYDPLGQLIRVNSQQEQATWTYRYDQGGNILEKKRYAYTTEADLSSLEPAQTLPYTYGDANWKDKLTAYGGKPITYDAIGNPLAYDGWAYTWKAGRMLSGMANGSAAAEFTYDHTGLRVKKSVNGVDTLYILNGKRICIYEEGREQRRGRGRRETALLLRRAGKTRHCQVQRNRLRLPAQSAGGRHRHC